MPLYKTSAVGGPATVILTGPGPRNPMGLPPRPSGAKAPPTPPQPMSSAAAYSTPVLPGPNTGGYLFLPSSPVAARMGQAPPVHITPTPSSSRILPTVVLGGGLYQGSLGTGGSVPVGQYQPGPAPTPPIPTSTGMPNNSPTYKPIMMGGSFGNG